MSKTLAVLISGVLMLIAASAQASWFSKVTGFHVNLNTGRVAVEAPDLGAVPEMIKNLPKDLSQAMLNPTGSVLAAAIRYSSSQAEFGAQPIPAHVREALSPYFPSAILDAAKWNVYSATRVNLDKFVSEFQGEGAVTLDNVIVFRNEQLAMGRDIELWAHEMFHVMQYQNMGVETFAHMYVINYDGIESDAKNFARSVVAGAAQPVDVQAGAFTSSIPGEELAGAIQKVYPAHDCILLTQQGRWIHNTCPIPIRVARFTYLGAMGQAVQSECFDDPAGRWTCIIPPGGGGPALSPSGGPLVSTDYVYPSIDQQLQFMGTNTP